MTAPGVGLIYTGRLAGLAVFDQLGDPLGTVRDVVAIIPARPRIGRAVGLVVEVAGRRRVFLPLTRVSTVSPTQVIVSGAVTLSRFTQRSTETLLLGEVRGRTATLHPGTPAATPVVIEDIAIAPDLNQEWRIAAFHVRPERDGRDGWRRWLPGRRRPSLTADSSELGGLTDQGRRGSAASLRVALDELRPTDLAEVVRELNPSRRLEVLATLDDERLADVLEELSEDDQIEILAQLEVERAADVLEAMQPDDAADLLGELPKDQAEQLLALMDPEEADDVRRLLSYSDDSAGGLMTTDPVILSSGATVAEALARVRRKDLTPALAGAVFVCRPPLQTPSGRFLGYVHVQRLLREPPGTAVGTLIDDTVDPVGPGAALAVVTRRLAAYNLISLPVTDSGGRLIGAITVDDVLDHLLPRHWRELDDEEEGGDDERD